MKKPLFDINDRTCEHRKVSYELRPRGGAWSSIYNADAVQVEVRTCALTGTDCISRYKFDCPRYANALLLKQMTDEGDGDNKKALKKEHR